MHFYEILNVSRDCTDEELKKSYRSLAFQWHPDRNPNNVQAESMFKRIVEAYETLCDPVKRQAYDRKNPVKVARPVKTKEDFEQERKEKDDKNPRLATQEELDRIQCAFFGSSSTGRNVLVHLKLTPSEMRNGCTKEIKIKKRDLCHICTGDGDRYYPCPRCHNNKTERAWCDHCDRTGIVHGRCNVCNGEGVAQWVVNTIKVVISRGVQPGHAINVMGEGECAPKKAPGNVRVIVV